MKNKLHHDAELFWKCRKIVLSEHSNIIKIIAQAIMNRITRFYNAVIPNQATIRGVPITPHGLIGIFISKQAVLGKNVTIYQNVTIGSNQKADSKNFGSPIIGDNVVIGANSCVVGGVKIGNNTFIGAGTSVAVDVPDNSTVVNGKVRIIHRKEML